MHSKHKGIAAAVTAFLFWGLTPLYWSQLREVPALESIYHRVIWSFVLLLIVVILKQRAQIRRETHRRAGSTRLIPNRSILLQTTIAGILVVANWLTYVWAVTHGRTLEASLGYYINPLVSIALGTLVLRERLDRLQAIAVFVAGLGVIYLTIRLGSLPWVSLVLAGSFGVYGLIKKKLPIGSTHSLALELLPIAPFATLLVIVGLMKGNSSLGYADIATFLLLFGSGAITVVPLVLFGYATQTIRLSDVGFAQYIAPTMMLLIGVFVFGEPFDIARIPGFLAVWCALILYSLSVVRATRSETNSVDL